MANVAQKYAKALFDVATENEITNEVYDELKIVSNVSNDFYTELKSFDANPSHPAKVRHELVEQTFDSANPYLKNMLFVLANNRHLSLIDAIFKAYQFLYNQKLNQDYAIVESVYELSDDELNQIESVIKKQMNLSNVIVNTKINSDLIGGIRVKVGTKVIDGSVKNDLQQLTSKFKRTN